MDGRIELLGEIADAPTDLREALRDELVDLMAKPEFVDSIGGHLPGDSGSQGRVTLVMERLRHVVASVV